MRLLHVISSMNPKDGGVCKAVQDIIIGMQKTDPLLKNEVVCMDNPNDLFLKNYNFKIHSLGKGKTSWSYNVKLYYWLKKWHNQYDFIIVHGLWQYQSYLFQKLKSEINLNYWIMPHGMLDPYFQKAKNRKLKAIRNNIIWHFIEKKYIKKAEGLLFTCEEEKQIAGKCFKNYSPQKELIVGLAVDYPPIYDEIMKKEFYKIVKNWNEVPYFLFLSRIHPKKGVDNLIKSYIKLEKEVNNLPQLIIAGPGLDTPYGNKISQQSKASPNIILTDMLTGNSKWGAFYNCESFILPSHQENFGIAVVEALSCSKPVLISNQINIWREIENCRAGLIENDNEEGTYSLLRNWFFLEKSKKEEFNKHAKEAYEKLYTFENFSKNFVAQLKTNKN